MVGELGAAGSPLRPVAGLGSAGPLLLVRRRGGLLRRRRRGLGHGRGPSEAVNAGQAQGVEAESAASLGETPRPTIGGRAGPGRAPRRSRCLEGADAGLDDAEGVPRPLGEGGRPPRPCRRCSLHDHLGRGAAARRRGGSERGEDGRAGRLAGPGAVGSRAGLSFVFPGTSPQWPE